MMTVSRRSILAGIALLPAVSLPALEPDPILDLTRRGVALDAPLENS